MVQPDESSFADASSQRILDGIRRLVQVLREGSRAAESEVGLTGAQLFVLLKLSEAAPLSVAELAARTLTHQSSVSVVVSRLVTRGLVARRSSARDARRVELTVTKRGLKLLAKAPDAAQERLMGALDRLPRETRQTLDAALTRLVGEMGITEASPTMFFESVDSDEPPQE